MKRESIIIILFLFISLISFIILNIEFNDKEEVVINSSNIEEEYYYDEETLYYKSTALVYNNEFEAYQVLNETNKYREKNNVHPLILDSNLSKVANIRAIELAQTNNLTHQRPNNSYYSELFEHLSIDSSFFGENIARGYTSASEVCDSWSNSSGHYANMIKSKYNKMGVGVYTYNGITYWVQIFSD